MTAEDGIGSDERATIALVAVFGASLLAVRRIDEPVAWVGWAGAMVVLSGWALVRLNR